jgi:hypothetical protein
VRSVSGSSRTVRPLDAEVFRRWVPTSGLRVHFDIEPREGKDPVQFTTFGARSPAIEPWVFTAYRIGGLTT